MKQQENNGIRGFILKADFEAAIRELKALYANDKSLKDSVHFYTLFGVLEGVINQKEASLRCVSKAQKIQTGGSSLFLDMMAIRLHVLFHEDRKADELFTLFVERNPKSSVGWGERGMFLYHQEKFGPAAESLDIALELDEWNILAQGYKALNQRRTGSPEEKESFRTFVTMDAKSDICYLSKGEIYDNMENYEKMRAYVSKVLDNNPENLAAIYLKRESLIKENKFSLARKFERKLESSGFFLESFDKLPDDRFFVLGKILYFLEQSRFLKNLGGVPFGEARGTSPRSLGSVERTAYSPSPVSSPVELGGAEALGVQGAGVVDVAGSVKDARKSFSTINQGKFMMADQYFEKGMKKLEKKDYEEAIRFFKQAVSYNPDHILALNEIGLTYMITGDEQGYRIDRAVNYFDQTLLRDPSFAQAHYYKFVAFLLVGNYESALASIDMAIAVEPDNIEYLLDKGVLLGDIKRSEFAVEVFEEVLKKDPENPTAWSSLAFIYKEMRNKKMEVKSLNKFLTLEPKDVNAWFERGMVFKRFARYETAISCFDHILSLEEDHHLAMKEKGMCLRLMGRREEGDELLARADQNRIRYLDEAAKLDSSLSGVEPETKRM